MFKSVDCLIYSLALEARTPHPYFRFVLNTNYCYQWSPIYITGMEKGMFAI